MTSAQFSEFERAGWDERAIGYDRMLGRVTARVVDHMLDAAQIRPDVRPAARVLDVACGPGDATAAAAARGARAVGVDVATAMVHVARRRHPGLPFLLGAAEALPFAAGSFDAVLGGFMVHHLAEAVPVVREFARVLAPGGRVALTAWDAPERCALVGVLVEAIAEVGAQPPADLPAGPPFFQFSATDAFTALLTDGGFDDVEVHTIGFAHPVAGPDELWAGLIHGTVRSAALVVGQPHEVQRAIRAAFDRRAARYAEGPRLAVPVSVRLAVGRAGN
jgi:SAM-dependent methyltransferase